MTTIEVPLTKGRNALVSQEDADWAFGHSWCVTNGYPARGVWSPVRRVFYMHRLIAVRAGILAGYDDDPRLVDHIDRDRLNNQRSNLRSATHSQNLGNVAPKGRSGMLGVALDPRRGTYEAAFFRECKRYRKAGFRTPEDAAAWREAKLAELGSF